MQFQSQPMKLSQRMKLGWMPTSKMTNPRINHPCGQAIMNQPLRMKLDRRHCVKNSWAQDTDTCVQKDSPVFENNSAQSTCLKTTSPGPQQCYIQMQKQSSLINESEAPTTRLKTGRSGSSFNMAAAKPQHSDSNVAKQSVVGE